MISRCSPRNRHKHRLRTSSGTRTYPNKAAVTGSTDRRNDFTSISPLKNKASAASGIRHQPAETMRCVPLNVLIAVELPSHTTKGFGRKVWIFFRGFLESPVAAIISFSCQLSWVVCFLSPVFCDHDHRTHAVGIAYIRPHAFEYKLFETVCSRGMKGSGLHLILISAQRRNKRESLCNFSGIYFPSDLRATAVYPDVPCCCESRMAGDYRVGQTIFAYPESDHTCAQKYGRRCTNFILPRAVCKRFSTKGLHVT